MFNLIGEDIRVLVDELQTEGKYEAVVIVDSFPSGIYFYKLQARDLPAGKAGFVEEKNGFNEVAYFFYFIST